MAMKAKEARLKYMILFLIDDVLEIREDRLSNLY